MSRQCNIFGRPVNVLSDSINMNFVIKGERVSRRRRRRSSSELKVKPSRRYGGEGRGGQGEEVVSIRVNVRETDAVVVCVR